MTFFMYTYAHTHTHTHTHTRTHTQAKGLDIRLSEEEAVDTFYSEVRWEVEEEVGIS